MEELRKIRDSEFLISANGEVYSPSGKRISTWIENNTGYTLFRIKYNTIIQRSVIDYIG